MTTYQIHFPCCPSLPLNYFESVAAWGLGRCSERSAQKCLSKYSRCAIARRGAEDLSWAAGGIRMEWSFAMVVCVRIHRQNGDELDASAKTERVMMVERRWWMVTAAGWDIVRFVYLREGWFVFISGSFALEVWQVKWKRKFENLNFWSEFGIEILFEDGDVARRIGNGNRNRKLFLK